MPLTSIMKRRFIWTFWINPLLKDGETRADTWRDKWDHEQTEIDALLALYPGTVDRVAREAVAPFYDATLAPRTAEQERQLRDAAERILQAHPVYAALQAAIEAAHWHAQQAANALHDIQATARERLKDIRLPRLQLPEPELGGQAPRPLFTPAAAERIPLDGRGGGAMIGPHPGLEPGMQRVGPQEMRIRLREGQPSGC